MINSGKKSKIDAYSVPIPKVKVGKKVGRAKTPAKKNDVKHLLQMHIRGSESVGHQTHRL